MEATASSSNKYEEEVFNEGVVISADYYPMFNQMMNEAQLSDKEKTITHVGDQVQGLAEAMEWMFAKVDKMDHKNKNIFIPLGASRTGKGTLLAALLGYKLKIFNKKKLKDNPVAQKAALRNFMAPCDPEDESLPIELDFMSHQHNSHTIYPKTLGAPESFFEGFENTIMVDFPGMFDSKGTILEIAMLLSLQRIIMQAKTAKVVVMVSAGILTPENQKMITSVKEKLKFMF